MKRFETCLKESGVGYIKNQSMAQLTSFRLGGDVKFFVLPKSIEELKKILSLVKVYGYKFFILGNGSNVLFKSQPSVKVVISLKNMPRVLYAQGLDVHVSANVNLFDFNKFLKDNGLGGFEFSFGIPGSIGGSIKGNAGAFGQSVCDFVKNIEVLDLKTLKIKKITKKSLKYCYRKTNIDDLILAATFTFQQSDFVTVSAKQMDFLQKRRDSQPLLPSAGSVFKHDGSIIPAKIIDEAGLRGLQVGGAKVSDNHAGFIVKANENCTSEDVVKLIKIIKKTIKNRFKIDLKEEILII